jgi:hypothetical protein
MSAHRPEAIDDYSKSRRPRTARSGGLGGLATVAAGLGVAGAILAFVASFSTVIEIRVLTVTPESYNGMDRYGPALLLLGAFGLLMVAGAWRGARPAMAALSLAGLAVVLIAVLIDVPDLNDEGVWPLADQYEDATASAGIGFYFETASGVLMLLSGALMLLLAPRREREAVPRREREAPPRREREPVVAPPRPGHSGAVGDKRPPDRNASEIPAPAPAEEEWLADDPLASKAQRLTQGTPPRKRRQGGLVGRIRRDR